MSKVQKWFFISLDFFENLWLKFLLIWESFTLVKMFNKRINDVLYPANSTEPVDNMTDHHTVFKIPEAKGLPVIGTLLDLIAAGGAPQLHKYIDKRHKQLGSIFRERLGGTQDAVFVQSASLMRNVFLYEGQHPRHPLPDAWTLYNTKNKCQRGLFFMEGPEWLHNRRILNKFLLNGNLSWMNAHIEASTDRLISAWKSQLAKANGDEFHEISDLELQLYRWAIDVICSIMFGSSALTCSHLEAALNDFSKIVHKVFENSSALMNFPASLAKTLNLKMWTQFEENVSEVLSKSGDIIDMFVALSNEEETIEDSEVLFNKLKGAGMPLEMIKRIFVDLVIAAGDTTAYTSEWALYLLAQDDDLQQRLSKEAIYDDESVSLVHGLLKETLRLFPVAPFIGRFLAYDATIADYHIKKDTLVLLSLYTAGRDDAHFPDPLTVRPERWQRSESSGELQGVLQAHGTLPFAIGNRSCIGRKVAVNQICNLISAIVTNFQLKYCHTKPLDSVLRLVTVPNLPLRLAIKQRE